MSANDGLTGYLTDPYVGLSVLDAFTCMTVLGELSAHWPIVAWVGARTHYRLITLTSVYTVVGTYGVATTEFDGSVFADWLHVSA